MNQWRHSAVCGLLVLTAGAVCGGGLSGDWVDIPAGECRIGSRAAPGNPPRLYRTAGFRLGRCEVTVREFCGYLRRAGGDWRGNHRQVRGGRGNWRPARGQAARPITGIDRSEAEAYCAWLSERHGVQARLPDPEEWEYAARGGRTAVRFPWGWGDPSGHAVYAAAEAARAGSRGEQGFGLCDMAGNVFEWCRGDGAASGEIRGGSWAERDARALEVYRPVRVSPAYRDADVGFRVLIEPARKPPAARRDD